MEIILVRCPSYGLISATSQYNIFDYEIDLAIDLVFWDKNVGKQNNFHVTVCDSFQPNRWNLQHKSPIWW